MTTAIATFERLFRSTAGLDVDKSDLRRCGDLVDGEVTDLIIRGQAIAKANGRDILQPWDLPVTKGLQECMHVFEKSEAAGELWPVLEQRTSRPPLDVAYSDETKQFLPGLAGGLTVAIGRTMKVVDPELKNPTTDDWERADQLLDLLL
jgi:hypothetical protein